jgi:hypothetical protein
MSRFSHAVKHVNPVAAVSPLAGGYLTALQNTQGGGQSSGGNSLPVSGPEGDIKRYEEVYNRPASQTDPNRGVYAWGDDANRTYQLAYNSFHNLFGRAPTQGEFSQAMGAFQGANSQITGNAYLANLQQQYQQNPTLDPSNPNNSANKNVGDITGNVQQQFKTILGRAATQDELQHFTEAIRSNQTDAYGLSSFLKQQPEYQNAQDTQFRSGLNSELAGYDQKAFDRQKQDVMSDYASRGFGGSSSLDYALTDLMGKLAENRGKYLAGVSSQQYGGNKDLAVGNYKNTVDQFYNNYQQNRQGQNAYGQSLIDRGFQGADYGQQMRDYNNSINSQRGYNNTLHGPDWINLGLNAVGTGAKMYGASQMGGGGGGGGYSYLDY